MSDSATPWIDASLVAQTITNLPAMQGTWAWSLGQGDLLEKGMATHSSILAWRIPWTEKPCGLQSMGLQRVIHDWMTNTSTFHFFMFFFLFPGSFPATYKLTKISFILKTKSLEFMLLFQAIAWFLFSFSTQHLETGLLYLLSLTPHLPFFPPLTLVSAGGVGGCAHLSIESSPSRLLKTSGG